MYVYLLSWPQWALQNKAGADHPRFGATSIFFTTTTQLLYSATNNVLKFLDLSKNYVELWKLLPQMEIFIGMHERVSYRHIHGDGTEGEKEILLAQFVLFHGYELV